MIPLQRNKWCRVSGVQHDDHILAMLQQPTIGITIHHLATAVNVLVAMCGKLDCN